jgi:alkylation response protein AidB-like acyl-CoA dehydrogenase
LNTFLSETDQSVKAEFDRFAKEQLAPVAQALESRQANLAYFLQKLGHAGLLGISVPAEYGGRGSPFLHLILLAEAFGVYNPGVAFTLAGHATVIELVKRFGTDNQRSKYLPLLACGELLGAFAYFEDEAQDPFEDTNTQIQTATGGKLILGKKKLVVNGRLAKLMVVLAVQVDAQKQKTFGMWLADSSGDHAIETEGQPPFIGLRSTYLDDVNLKGYPVTAEDRLGMGEQDDLEKVNEECRYQFEFALASMKTILAASALGMLEGVLAQSAKYAQETKRFGIALKDSQAAQWRLADLSVESTAARLLIYKAAWSKDESQEDFLKNAAMCKSYVARAAHHHCSEAVQVLGLLQSTADSQIERFYRDAKMFELLEGTIDRERVLLSDELGI